MIISITCRKKKDKHYCLSWQCKYSLGKFWIDVDGSDVNLPPLKDDVTTFVKSNTAGTGYHQLHLNAVYNVLGERYVDNLLKHIYRYIKIFLA